MLKQNTAITVEGKQRLMPFVATPRGEIVFDGAAWLATLMGNKTNGGGTTTMLSILSRVPELAHGGRRLEDHANAELRDPSYLLEDKAVYFTPETARVIVHHCNSGMLGKTFYKKDNITLTETYDRINSIKDSMRVLVDTMCATIRRRLVQVAEVEEVLVGVPIAQQQADEVLNAPMQIEASLHVEEIIEEPRRIEVQQRIEEVLNEPQQIEAPQRIEEVIDEVQAPIATVSIEAFPIVPMEVANISIDYNGKQQQLSFITTKLHEILVGGAAWTAMILESNDNNYGSKKLTKIAEKDNRLFHENRDLKIFSNEVLTNFVYKFECDVFATTNGAKEIVAQCNAGKLNKKFYTDEGRTCVGEIAACINARKKHALAILDMIETLIKQRLEEQAKEARDAPPKPVPFVPNGEDISMADKNAAGNAAGDDYFRGDIVKCERAVQLKKEAATIEVSKAKELAIIELDMTEKKQTMEIELTKKKQTMELELTEKAQQMELDMAEKKHEIERNYKRKAMEEQKEMEENDPRFKKQRDLDVLKLTMEEDTLRRTHAENVALAEKAKHAAAKEEADRAKAEAKAEADKATEELDQAFADYNASGGVKRAAPLLRLHEMLKEQFPNKSSRTKFINQHCNPKAAKVKVARSDAFAAAPTPEEGIYVIEVEGKLPIKRYVGSSTNIKNRFRQHRDGNGGAACIHNATKYTMLKPAEMFTARLSDNEKLHQWEQRETLEQIFHNDIESVYGGDFAMAGRSSGDVKAIFNGVCGHMDLCKKCGNKGHFASACRATNKAKWAGGGAI